MLNQMIELLSVEFPSEFNAVCVLDEIRHRIFDQTFRVSPPVLATWLSARVSGTLLREYHTALAVQRVAFHQKAVSEDEVIFSHRIGEMLSDTHYRVLGDLDRSELVVTTSGVGPARLTIATPWTLIPLWDMRTLRYRTLMHILGMAQTQSYVVETVADAALLTPV